MSKENLIGWGDYIVKGNYIVEGTTRARNYNGKGAL